MPEVIVVGCGVSGLTSAIRLLENGFDVGIITRELPEDTTSTVAAAIWSGHMQDTTRQGWASASLQVFQQLAQDDSTGVIITRFRDIYPHAIAEPWFKDAVPYCEQIPAHDLPAGYLDGYSMDVPLIQTPLYMAYLMRRFRELGGTIVQRAIATLDELSSNNRLIINCTGVWARHVANDPDVYPLWGQVLLVNAPHISESLMDDVAYTYIFPRRDGVVLGGVSIANRWERDVDPAITEDILERCEGLIAGLGQAEIITQKVGLRPARHQVRLEAETLSEGSTVIHNYGHGAVGFTLSWACADDVLALAKKALAS